jgi:hypothetical protein
MSRSPYDQHAHSLHVPRPAIPRQRSNSLPPGLASMNAEEAGILFSAAERATARRRRARSIHHTRLPDSPPVSDNDSPLSTVTAFKPSPLRQNTSIRESMNKPLPAPPITTPDQLIELSTSERRVPSEIALSESFLSTLPVSPLSPIKRQVTSKSLKSYADGLFSFTHNVLASTIPTIQGDTHQSSTIPSELQELASPVKYPFRPRLESKFSDWSIATGANQESRRDSMAVTPIDLNSALLSPDSFFGVEETPRRAEFDFNVNRFSGISFASSETYEPPSSVPPLTPPSRSPLLAEDKEISYFTNFDQYLNTDNWPLRNETPQENVMIDLSPLELEPTPAPPPTQRKRSATTLRMPARSAPLLRPNAPPPWSQPSTPYQVADIAIMVPNQVIKAIGAH